MTSFNHWDDLLNLTFDGGYPTPEAVERLFDELDFQRAVQVYLWALPAMNVDAMRLYAPTQAFFDKTWKPGDIEKVK